MGTCFHSWKAAGDGSRTPDARELLSGMAHLNDGVFSSVTVKDLLGLDAEGSGAEGEHHGRRVRDETVEPRRHGVNVVVAGLHLRQALLQVGDGRVLHRLL